METLLPTIKSSSGGPNEGSTMIDTMVSFREKIRNEALAAVNASKDDPEAAVMAIQAILKSCDELPMFYADGVVPTTSTTTEEGGDDATIMKKPHPPVIGIATKPRKHDDLPEWLKKTSKSSYFKALSGMKFGYHGVMGILALVTTSWYLASPSDSALLLSMMFGVLNSVFALALLKQVPKDTHIIGAIWAGHHDAFDLAIRVVFYINIRCLESFLKPRLLYKFAVMAGWTQFFDLACGKNVDPRRPNSWFIVYPFFAAALFDLWRAAWTDIPLKTNVMMTIQLYLLVCSFLYSAAFRNRNPFYKKLMFWVSVGIMLIIIYVFFVPEAQKSLQRDWFMTHHHCPWLQLWDVIRGDPF